MFGRKDKKEKKDKVDKKDKKSKKDKVDNKATPTTSQSSYSETPTTHSLTVSSNGPVSSSPSPRLVPKMGPTSTSTQTKRISEHSPSIATSSLDLTKKSSINDSKRSVSPTSDMKGISSDDDEDDSSFTISSRIELKGTGELASRSVSSDVASPKVVQQREYRKSVSVTTEKKTALAELDDILNSMKEVVETRRTTSKLPKMNRPEIEEPASIMTVRQRPNRAESASIDFDELENMLNDMSNSISMVSSASNSAENSKNVTPRDVSPGTTVHLKQQPQIDEAAELRRKIREEEELNRVREELRKKEEIAKRVKEQEEQKRIEEQLKKEEEDQRQWEEEQQKIIELQRKKVEEQRKKLEEQRKRMEEEQRKLEMELEERMREEEEQRRRQLEEHQKLLDLHEQKRKEDEQRRIEEQRKFEEELKAQEQKRKELEKIRIEEQRKYEEQQKMMEQKRREEELKRLEEQRKYEEELRIKEQKRREEEMKRLEQQIQFEEQQRLLEQKRREDLLKQFEEEKKKQEIEKKKHEEEKRLLEEKLRKQIEEEERLKREQEKRMLEEKVRRTMEEQERRRQEEEQRRLETERARARESQRASTILTNSLHSLPTVAPVSPAISDRSHRSSASTAPISDVQSMLFNVVTKGKTVLSFLTMEELSGFDSRKFSEAVNDFARTINQGIMLVPGGREARQHVLDMTQSLIKLSLKYARMILLAAESQSVSEKSLIDSETEVKETMAKLLSFVKEAASAHTQRSPLGSHPPSQSTGNLPSPNVPLARLNDSSMSHSLSSLPLARSPSPNPPQQQPEINKNINNNTENSKELSEFIRAMVSKSSSLLNILRNNSVFNVTEFVMSLQIVVKAAREGIDNLITDTEDGDKLTNSVKDLLSQGIKLKTMNGDPVQRKEVIFAVTDMLSIITSMKQ